MPSVLVGPPDRIVELLHERRDSFGLSYCIFSDSALDAALPVLEAVASL